MVSYRLSLYYSACWSNIWDYYVYSCWLLVNSHVFDVFLCRHWPCQCCYDILITRSSSLLVSFIQLYVMLKL